MIGTVFATGYLDIRSSAAALLAFLKHFVCVLNSYLFCFYFRLCASFGCLVVLFAQVLSYMASNLYERAILSQSAVALEKRT